MNWGIWRSETECCQITTIKVYRLHLSQDVTEKMANLTCIYRSSNYYRPPISRGGGTCRFGRPDKCQPIFQDYNTTDHYSCHWHVYIQLPAVGR